MTMGHVSTSHHPTLAAEHPLAASEWNPEALAKRVFILALFGAGMVTLAFVLVGLVGKSF
jgi:hypothetical protein